MESVKKNSLFRTISKGVLISVVVTICCLTIFALLLVNTDLNENLIQPVIICVTAISILIGSCIATRKVNKNGILNGCIIGFLYIFIIYIVSSLMNNMNFEIGIETLIMAAFAIIGGAIGGIVGVNI